MGSLLVVMLNPVTQSLAQFGAVGKGPQVKILILERPPQPLNENVILDSATAIHADGYFVLFQKVSEGPTGELSPLVSVKDLWFSILAQGLFEGLNAKV